MRHFTTLAALVLTSGISAVVGEPVQSSNLRLPSNAASHQQAVKQIFLDSYAAYKSVTIALTP